jgi:uncharacterized protein YbjT (DUF2867 family)
VTKTFVVAGATGRQGGATARHLKAAGHRVVGITHSPEKASKLEGMGIEPRVADLRDPATLVRTLTGVDGFFIVTDPFSTRHQSKDVAAWVNDEIRQGHGALEAALMAKVPHVVLASVATAAQEQGLPVHKSKTTIESRAKELETACTILRPSFFMDTWIWRAFDGSPQEWLATRRIEWAVKPDTIIPHVATDDIGRVAAWSFDHPSESIGQAWELAGELSSFPEIAQGLSRRFGRTIEFVELPADRDSFPLNPALVRGDYSWDVGALERLFSFPMTSFEEYLGRLETIP